MDKELELAVTAARSGGDVLMRYFRKGVLEHVQKGHLDYATQADIESEQAVRDVLAQSGLPVFGEEQGWGGVTPDPHSRAWYVDPLCGTANFAAGITTFCVNVGLVENGAPVLGAVYEPVTGEALYGHIAAGAWVKSDGVPQRAEPSDRTGLVDLDFDKPVLGQSNYRTLAMAMLPDFSRWYYPSHRGSTLALAYTSCGRCAAFFDTGNDADVHFVAGVAVCLAAGAVVTDITGGPWRIGASGVVAAANDETHSRLLGWARQLAL